MRPPRETVKPRPNFHQKPRRLDATPVVILAGVVVAAATVFAGWTLLAGGISIDLSWESFRDPKEESAAAPAAETSEATPGATASPTPGLPAVNGSPFSLATLENAWKAKGMTLFSAGGAGGFSGTAVTPAVVRAQRGGESATLAVLVYPNSNVVKQDWNLSAGQAPSPAGGRTIPGHQSVWWNQNVVVVALSGSAEVANEAKAAFLGL
jgi:hypothetical protein